MPMIDQRGLTFAGLILAFGPAIQTSNAQAVQGNVELVNSSTCEVAGWARDSQNANPIQVLIYRDGDAASGTLDTSFIANLLRTDLPFSDQNHGFDHIFIGDAGLADGRDHTIYAYGVSNAGVAGPLSSNGQTVHCGLLTATATSYGATGNGTTDDSDAIQAAIDDTAPGGTVVIPEGTYIIGTSHGSWGTYGAANSSTYNATCGVPADAPVLSGLSLTKTNITITGVGRGSILMLAANAKMRIIGWTAPNVLIQKLVLDGNGARRLQIDPSTGQPYSWPCGLIVDALLSGYNPSGGATIQDVESRNGIEDGMGMFISPNFTVNSVYSHHNGGVAFNPTVGGAAGGIGISLAGGANQTATNNIVIGNLHGIMAAFGSVGVNISGNVVVGNYGLGMILGTGNATVPYTPPDSGFTVDWNWIEQNGSIGFAGLAIESGQDGALSANHVQNNFYNGVLINDFGAQWPASINWQLQNNVIAANALNGIEVGGRSMGVTLLGNQLENNGSSFAGQVVVDPPVSSGALNANWATVNTLSFTPPAANPITPVITAAGIVNAASEKSAGISPGEILAIYGSNLGPAGLVSAAPNSDGRFDRIVSGTRVLFDGVPGAIWYTSAGQVAVIAPYYLYWKDSTSVQVEYNGIKSNTVRMAIQPSQPAVFTLNASGQGPGAILNQDYSVNSASNPAARGSIVILYATGEGQTDPAAVDGLLANSVTLPKPRSPVSVTIGGVTAQVSYAGAAPTLVAGVMQINAVVPAAISVGAAVPVEITVGGSAGPTGVTMAVN
jgi:uncharacterized protein (TIGR03437 family)